MNQVRTTVTLPSDTHEYLMTMSFKQKKTLGELIDGFVKNKNFLSDKQDIEKRLADFRAFCVKLGKKAGKTDWTKLVREERNRDE